MGWVVNATLRPLYPRERPCSHCIGGWVGPRAGLDGCGKSRPPAGIRSPDRPARSESLYRLSCPGLQMDHGTLGTTNLMKRSSYKDGEEWFETVLNLHTFSPTLTPLFFTLFKSVSKKNISLSRKILRGCHLRPPPPKVMPLFHSIYPSGYISR